MAQKSRNVLKGYFATGKYPTDSQFADLIDSFVHYLDTVAATLVSNDSTVEGDNVKEALQHLDSVKVELFEGFLLLAADKGIKINNIQVIGEQQSGISDASESHSVTEPFSASEIKGYLDALGSKINDILGVMRTHGLIESPS